MVRLEQMFSNDPPSPGMLGLRQAHDHEETSSNP
jgi:hypothetical protein